MNADKSQLFMYYWKMIIPEFASMEEPKPEYVFYSCRKWRFDWAWPDYKIAVEIEGNAWNVKGGGRHMQDKDLEKYNAAAWLGWRIFRFSPAMLIKNPSKYLTYLWETLCEAKHADSDISFQ